MVLPHLMFSSSSSDFLGFVILMSYVPRNVWSFSCPFSEGDPCRCSPPSEDLTVLCYYLDTQSLSSMMDKLRNFRHLPVTHLHVKQANLTNIQSGIFHQLNLRSIRFDASTLSTTSAELFLGTDETLEDLQFRWCELGFPLSHWTLGHLPRLERLAVTQTPMSSVLANLLPTPASKLKHIYFYGNSITDVESGSLLTAFSLQVLVLNSNQIKSLSRTVFPRPAPELRELHLRDNQLENLTPDIWKDMSRLKLIDLSANRLHVLNEATWRPLWGRLTDIYVQGNPLHCDCDVRWLIQEENQMAREKKFARFFLGYCVSPAYLQYRALENLTSADLPC